MSSTPSPVSKRLKQARKAAGLSQKQLGIEAGIDEFSASPRMNQYETGKHTPDFLTLKNIAEVLKVPVAFFYTEDSLLAKFLMTYGALPRSARKKLIQSIKHDIR